MRNLVILFFILTALFLAYPEIDFMVVDLTYEPTKGFIWIDQEFFRFIYKAIFKIVPITIILLIFGLIYSALYKKYNLKIKIYYLLLCLMIGPEIIINWGLKDNFGRARPTQIKEKNKIYSPIFYISDQCKDNCSFTSGHAAIGFYFSALAIFCNRKSNKQLVVISSILFGGIVGLSRILQGAHFLSDVIFSGLIVNIINYGLYIKLFK